MAIPIRSPKDFWAGLLYAGFGSTAIVLARDYGWGSSSRMGPGYFPTVLGSLLLLIGVASFVRSFIARGEPIGGIAWKGLILVTAGTLLFGFLLRPAGLVPALLALILVSAAASVKFRFDWKAMGLMLVLVAFCSLVFVKGLGLPVPLLGSWFSA